MSREPAVGGPFPVADSILFQLGVAVNLSTAAFYRRYARPYRLGLVDWQVLLLTASRPGVSPKEIGDFLAVDKMTITRSVRRLLAQKRIRTSDHPADRRRLALSITPKGAAVCEAIMPGARIHQREALAALSPADRRRLRALLRGLITTLRSIAAGESDGRRGRRRAP